jgi:uncharacterized protein Veg
VKYPLKLLLKKTKSLNMIQRKVRIRKGLTVMLRMLEGKRRRKKQSPCLRNGR